MSFGKDTKTRMFIRSGRLCCLCLKQCGTNIEAAHIIAEASGGSNDEDNGIPLCFDCHEEIGSYNLAHPRGNKFTPKELKARRDFAYQLVESGAIYAQLLATQLRRSASLGEKIELPEDMPEEPPSAEGKQFARILLREGEEVDEVARKVSLLSQRDKAFVIDILLRYCDKKDSAIQALALIIVSHILSEEEERVVLESVIRKNSLFGSIDAKIELLRDFPEDILVPVAEDLRNSLFAELLCVIERDQWKEVNKLVPVFIEHIKDVPKGLYAEYVMTLLSQSGSDSFNGAPAARRALRRLPEEMVREALPCIDKQYLYMYGRKESVNEFVAQYLHLAEMNQKALLEDFVSLSYREFSEKYYD